MATKINSGKEHSLKETELLLKLLTDEFLLMLNTAYASRNSARGRYSNKIFLQDQHNELKEITNTIIEYLTTHKRKMTDNGDFIKTLLSEHEDIISYYREKSSRQTGELHKDIVQFINSTLEKHGSMAWALRAQLK